MVCTYCGKVENYRIDLKYPDKYKFTREHILPGSLTGSLNNNPFVLKNVHQHCNNTAGTFIDKPFLDSFAVHNLLVEKAKDFANLEENPILPLAYMGVLEDVEHDGMICECWLGPTGDSIYHLHKPYSDDDTLPPFLGMPPTMKMADRKGLVDHGIAFLFVASNNPAWHRTIFFSFAKFFGKAKKYLGNGPPPKGGAFLEIADEHRDIHQRLKEMGGKQHNTSFKTDIFVEWRFMAKIALGFGTLMFGERFNNSGDADRLRKFLNAKTLEDRKEFSPQGIGFYQCQQISGISQFVGWPAGQVVDIHPVGNRVALSFSIYARLISVIELGELTGEYLDVLGNDGICYIIVPKRQKVIGPINRMVLINHRFNPEYNDEQLADIEVELEKYKIKPPFKI